MKRIILALLFVGLLVGLASLIPNNPSTAYPYPTPYVQDTTPQFDYRISNATDCRNIHLYFVNRPAHIPQDGIKGRGRARSGDTEYGFVYQAHLEAIVGDTEYFHVSLASREAFINGKVWVMDGTATVEGIPVWNTWNDKLVDCTGLVKHRVRFPLLLKARWLNP